MRRGIGPDAWWVAVALAVSPCALAQTVPCKPVARLPGIGFWVWQDTFRKVTPGSQVDLGPDIIGPFGMGAQSCNQSAPFTSLWSPGGQTSRTITVTAPPSGVQHTYTLTTTSAGETRTGTISLLGLNAGGPVCTLNASTTILTVGQPVTVTASCSPPSTIGSWTRYSSDTTGTATFSFGAPGGYTTEFRPHNTFLEGESVAVGFTVVAAAPSNGAIGFSTRTTAPTAGNLQPVILSVRRTGADASAPAASVGYACSVSPSTYSPTITPGPSGTLSFPTPTSTATITARLPELAAGATGATITCTLSNPQPTGVTIDAPTHTVSVTTPIFAVNVTSSITPTIANVSAAIQFRPEDIGTNASVYVFAMAPSSIVAGAAAQKDARLPWRPEGAQKDNAAACVLAQLNASGQLQAVSASSLQAYVTGVLSGQGQAVTVLNGVPTVNIAGATFYVGYGSSSSAMINSGLNRSVASIPGPVSCAPQPPQTGWWWNKAEGGRGYSLEARGNRVFFAAYLYEPTGRATWTIAAGNTSLDGSLFVGRLERYTGGQSLAGDYRGTPPVTLIGDLTLAFNDASHGTLTWPGGTIPIERFDIIPGGVGTQPLAYQPENGWWWNAQESGRGYFLEWQGSQLYMAGYMYDAEGNPLWYLTAANSTNLQSYAGTWVQYANGQSLGGTYRQPETANTNVAPVTIQFQGADVGLMTLPGNKTTTIRRYTF